MRVAIIHSQQPANQYTGGGVGVPDSEQAWMRKLALQLVPLLRAAGVDVIGPAPLGASYADNVRWVNAQTGVDVLVSLHSNALGNACILYGTPTLIVAALMTISGAVGAPTAWIRRGWVERAAAAVLGEPGGAPA